jgi:hypothetical protein
MVLEFRGEEKVCFKKEKFYLHSKLKLATDSWLSLSLSILCYEVRILV